MRFLLTEDIEAVIRNFPKISDEDFNRLIRLDPTFKEERDSVGTYGKWILTLFNKGKLTNEGHIYDILSRFEENKKNLKNKDINSFKTVEDLDAYLNDESNYKTKTHRQEVRDRQNARKNADLGNEADIIYEDETWEVWIPKTYAASCKLGQGTSWCTASTESQYYFDHYTAKGNLYININKKTGAKYQFHMQTKSYMDADDKEIDLMGFLIDNPKLLSGVYKEHLGELGKVISQIMESNGVIEYTDTTKIPSDIASYVKKITIKDGTTTIRRNSLSYCNNIREITIPSSVTLIERYAFAHCSGLASIRIPSSVETVERAAFYGCTSARELHIEEGVKYIDSYAFEMCDSLTDVVIPNSVVALRDAVFSKCRNLKSVTIGSGVQEFGDKLFFGCTSLEKVTLADGIPYIHRGMFESCSRLSSITIPDSVGVIMEEAFRNCMSLTHIQLPKNLATIQGAAFSGCSNLQELIIPDGVDEIPGYMCNGCRSLKTVKFGKGVNDIGAWSFANCVNLENIVIPNGVLAIREYAFFQCDAMNKVNIPDSVIGIEECALYNPGAHMVINLGSGVEFFDYLAFYPDAKVTAPPNTEVDKLVKEWYNKIEMRNSKMESYTVFKFRRKK